MPGMTLNEWSAADPKRTDDWIARQVGRDRTTITRVRNRTRGTSLETAVALCRLTDGAVPIEEFLSAQDVAA